MAITTSNLFDIPSDIVYLNCASFSPQLKAVTEAGQEAVKRKSSPWNIQAADFFNGPEKLRALVAELVGTDSDGIAFIPSVSYGISIAAANLPIQQGQTIVLLDKEYPSNYYAWQELAKQKHGELRMVSNDAQSWTDAVVAAIDERTAIVSVPNCHWTNGALIDLERVSDKAKSVGAALVIDASQSLGAYPLAINRIQPDFLVSVGYKWLLGPYGLGYLYAAPKWRQEGKPIEYSWLAKNESENFANLVNYRDDFKSGARRFDMGEFSGFIHVPMAIQAIRQVLDWGVETIQATMKEITAAIEKKAAAANLLFPSERVDHIIGLDFPGGIPAGLKEALEKEQIYVGFRGSSIRIAPYVYTRPQDIEKLFRVIQQFS